MEDIKELKKRRDKETETKTGIWNTEKHQGYDREA
jgi:hypothetical protein